MTEAMGMSANSGREALSAAKRYAQAQVRTADWLRAQGVPDDAAAFLPADRAARLWDAYLPPLNAASTQAIRWPGADQAHSLQATITRLCGLLGRSPVIVFDARETPVVAAQIAASVLLAIEPAALVNRGRDLMLCERSMTAGLCLELNAIVGGTEYELTAWGHFANAVAQ